MNLAALTQDLSAFAQVLVIDVALAGDNAVVVGMAVAGLPARQQRPAIILGIGGATLVRIGFGAIALQLLEILGLLLAGGLLLLWVCWKMYRELRHRAHAGPSGTAPPRKTLAQAMAQIVLADVSMSLDNVLAVAGASGGSTWVLAAGLAISVVLMGIAAGLLARILERQRWIAWVGLLIVLSVAVHMIWQGARAIAGAV
jgi:YjbE family integral membrane protein